VTYFLQSPCILRVCVRNVNYIMIENKINVRLLSCATLYITGSWVWSSFVGCCPDTRFAIFRRKMSVTLCLFKVMAYWGMIGVCYIRLSYNDILSTRLRLYTTCRLSTSAYVGRL